MFLVDTNVLSEARRGTPEAVRWLRSIQPDQIYLSVITIGEITRGVMLKTRVDAIAGARLEQWLRSLRDDYADKIIPIDSRVATEWGRLGALRPRGDADGLIAATAVVHDLTIVTRNVSDFADLPVAVIDPWNAST